MAERIADNFYLLNELYLGIADEGTTLNGKPIVCSSHNKLSQLILALSFGKTEKRIDQMADLSCVLARKVRKLRSFGSAGYDIVQVANGRLDGVLYRGVHIWDIAAAGIILKEAGGMISAAVQSNGKWNITASAPGVHQELANTRSNS